MLGAQVFDCGLMGRVGRFIDVVGVEGLYVQFCLRPMRRKQRLYPSCMTLCGGD